MKKLLFFLLATSFAFSATSGSLIVFTGISGSGKSSLTKAISSLYQAECFLEPEEDAWPIYIKDKQPYGEFASYTVFRAMRVNALWQASQKKERGLTIFSDSYYDKITSYYLGKPGMEWLIAPNDPYYPCVQALASLDTKLLPNADCIVLLDIPYSIWVERLRKRGRIRDSLEGFQESYAMYRSYVEEATRSVCREMNIPLITFAVTQESLDVQAKNLLDLLIKSEIITRKE